MGSRTLDEVTSVYATAVQAEIQWESVECDALEEFSTLVLEFQRAVGRDEEDTVWAEATRRLRSIRSLLSVAPVPMNHPDHDWDTRLKDLAHVHARARAQHSGQPVTVLRDALLAAQALSTRKENPLGDCALSILDQVPSGAKAVLLPSGRLVPSALAVLRRRPSGAGLKVITPSEFGSGPPLEAVVVMGSSYWYRKYPFVFSAPRAKHVHLLRWAWVADSLPEPELLPASRSGSRHVAGQPMPRRRRDTIEAADLAPSVDWDAIAARVNSAGASGGYAVKARIALLARGWAVALPGDDDSKVRIVEPDLVGDQRLQEIETRELDEGDCVLLRTHGGGELIVELANHDLGEQHAKDLRATQLRWKTALRREVQLTSPGDVARRLKKLGCARANYLNLRNWQSLTNLRTGDPVDFKAIMTLVGLEAEAQRIWDDMGTLTNAHRRAGHHVTRLLRESVADADLTPLVETGLMEFQLPGQNIGSLTACRIEAVAPEPTEITEHRIGQRVRAEDLWLA